MLFVLKLQARMYQSFLRGITLIALRNGGEVRSFNGDGVLVTFMEIQNVMMLSVVPCK